MARRFSWCSVVALVVLLFVTTEGFRERSTQVDDQKTQSANDRGTLRYNFKSPAETTTSVSTLSRTRSSRDRTSNPERHNAGSVSKPSINLEAKVESNRRSNFRTARTTERNGVIVATKTTNTSKTLEKDVNDTKKVEPIIHRRNNRRHPSENNEAAKLKVDEQNEAPKEVSRRMFNRKSDNSGVTEGLDNIGPSVFTATTESSRSRTGRKIHTTYSTTDLKIQVATSRRFGNERSEDVETTTAAYRKAESRSRSTTERIGRGRSGRSKVNHRENNSINRRSQDPLLSESESVRIDVPLALEATETLTVDATTDNVRSQRQSSLDSDRGSDIRNSSRTNSKTERSKHRGRSSHDFDHSNSVSRNSSRRGASKFNDYSTTEANEQTVGSRRNSISRDRLRNPESRKNEVRSRSRSRNSEHVGKSNSIASPERDAKRKSGDRNSPERRSRVSDVGRTAENRGQDQDGRGRSRSRSRVETATPVTSVYTITTSVPETTVSNDISSTSTEAEITSTTIAAATPATTTTTTTATTTTPRTVTGRSSTTTTAASEGFGRGRGRGRGGGNQGRKQPKEDFFNQGLGFRGRKILPEGSSNIGDSRKLAASKNESQHQGTLGWTLRRRLGHVNHSETEDTAILPTAKDQTNEVIPSSEQPTSTEIVTTVESSTATARRGFKKQQSSTEESSTVPETTTKSFRRGNKTFEKGRTVGFGKGAAEPEESDNYPPEFKARLSQLKVTNVPAPKTTSRTPLEDLLQNIFGRRSRGNSKAFEPDDLDTTASGNVILTGQSLVMNPLTLIKGGALRRVKKSSAALFAERSRMKLDLARRLVKPELNIEENDLDATTASSFSKPTKSMGKVDEVTTERRGSTEASQSADRGSKLSRAGKSLEDSSKVTVRPSILRKGRIISERMVTSISVEERPAKEETTTSYSSNQPSVVIAPKVEESESLVDSTKIPSSTLRDDNKPKEDEKLSRENIYTATTFKPKKSYGYHSRNSKSREQSTSDETFETAAAKKSQNSANKYSGSRRKSQASQEEVTRKPKFTDGVTKPTFRPRYSKQTKTKSSNDKARDQTSFTTTVPPATSRYSKKKSIIKSQDGKTRITTTEGPTTQMKKQDFRPRTATYRRHSDVPTTLVETTTKTETTGVAITPRVQKYHATLKSSTASPRSVPQEPRVNLNIVNETQQSAGIADISNGNSGNSNIFNPTKTAILAGNETLLNQLRSTVAPLLSSLGNRTPIFSGSYSNVNNANAAPRITPNGSPPRFSARYKGAELFVRKQNSVYQPTVPSITSSSTTSETPTEYSGSAPPIDISSPGEPKFLTFYQALETANITNRQENSIIRRLEQAGVVPQVDPNTTVANGSSSNPNNDTTSPIASTMSPQTPDTTTVQDSTQSSRLPEELNNSTPMVITGVPENPSTTAASRFDSPSTTSNAELSTTTERTLTNTTVIPEQTTTEQPEMTTVDPENIQTFQRSGIFDNIETTTVPANITTSSAPSTIVPTDVPVTTTRTSTTTTEGATSTSSDADASISENPESNTIQMSEATSTQAIDSSSTEASTTEAVSDNTIDVETTTAIPTTTARIKLIDIAQDILSRLQASFSTTVVPTTVTTMAPKPGGPFTTTTESGQESTTTVSPVNEILNVISDSEMRNGLETLSQLKDLRTTTVREDSGTTALPTSTTDQPAFRIAEGMTTQSAVDSVSTTLPTTATDSSNDMIDTEEISTQDNMNTVASTTPTSTTVTTQSPGIVSDLTTVSMTATTNDTLLTELMSIAKTLLSEERNETEQLTSSRVGKLTESGVDMGLSRVQSAESSSVSPDATTESVETSSTVAGSELTTTPADLSQNEVDSVELSTTDLPSDTFTTTVGSIVTDSEVEVVERNQTATLSPFDKIVESTVPSVTTETIQQTTLSNRISDSESDTGTTRSQTTTRTSETTITTPVNFELTTNTYDLVSFNLTTSTETELSTEQTTEVVTESTETAVGLINSTAVAAQPTVITSTNQPEVTTVSMDPENILARVNTFTNTSSESSESSTEQNTVVSTSELIQNETMSTTTAQLDANSTDVTEATTNQSFLTSTTEPTMDLVTNTPRGTANIPQTTPNLENKTPTVVARFQDTTSPTAQRTAGPGIGQTTEINTSMTTESSPPSGPSTSPPRFPIDTTPPSVETTTTTDARTTLSSRMNVVTVTPTAETTVPVPDTTDANANLVSTEDSASATTTNSPDNASSVAAGNAMATDTTTVSSQTTPGMTMSTVTRPPVDSGSPSFTTPYLGRFGGRRLTPAPRFSLSSTTKAPLRDYLIYGIYPNKTIVRKRPEDNLIDARNVDSPYVIFGIFPDGRLVRKFPNGTIIPDPPRSPVEVVFSLSTTTTTNRPPPRPYYNQANQGTYNQYQGPVYDNNRRPNAEPMRNVPTPGTVDLGLTGNAIGGPNGGGPDFTGPLGTPASVPSTNEMSNTPMNAQMGTTSNAMSAIAGRPPTDSQGSRIVQDRERDEATRTKEAGGQRSSVYIGQDKFVNYWTNGPSTPNPRVHSVNINSVATAINEGPSTSIPSFENLLNNQAGGQITAPPGFPWRDPLDQIFGITTPSPVVTASVASNTLEDSADTNGPVFARPVNPFVEVFTPFSSTFGNPKANLISRIQSATATTTTTAAPSTTTSSATPTKTTIPTTTSTTTMAPTTTTTTMAPTTTTTTTPATTTTSAPLTTPTSGSTVNSFVETTPFDTQKDLPNVLQQNAFGTTFDDLQFLNSLLQGDTRSSTVKTLTQVEQLLANKILSLALNNPGPTRAPKAVSIENASPNSIYQSSPKSLDPIVIDLSPSSTAAAPTWQTTPSTSEKPSTTTTTTMKPTTPPPTTAKTTLISTTKAPIPVAVKTTSRPRTTTPPPPLGFGASLWQALFGNGLFTGTATQAPVRPKQVKTTPKSVVITPKPVSTTQKPESTTLKTVDISKIQVNTPNSILEEAKPTIKQPLPKAATTTSIREDDAKLLLALLRAAQEEENNPAGSKKSSNSKPDDESFLRAILSGRALTTTTPAPSNDISDAALLAALLKAQGIEPPTPATDIREQLLLASLGQNVRSAPNALPATESTTITTRLASSATRPTVTTKKTVTPRPTSGPRIRTTTWSPSSTYPPPLFSSFSNYGTSQSSGGNNSGSGALFGATRAFSQLLGAAISGAAQQLQSLVRNGTRLMTGVVG